MVRSAQASKGRRVGGWAGLPGAGRGRAGESNEGSRDTGRQYRVSRFHGPSRAGSAAQSRGLWGRQAGEPGLSGMDGRS